MSRLPFSLREFLIGFAVCFLFLAALVFLFLRDTEWGVLAPLFSAVSSFCVVLISIVKRPD